MEGRLQDLRARKDKNSENKSNAWVLIYDQCAPELKNKLEGMADYNVSKKTNDMVLLLSMIQGYCCQFDTLNLNDEYMAIVGAIKNLLYFFQKPTQKTWTTTKTSWQWWKSLKNTEDLVC
jgi:hypothetical protein